MKIRSFRCDCCDMSRLAEGAWRTDPCEGCGFVQSSLRNTESRDRRAVKYWRRKTKEDVSNDISELSF